MIFNMYVGGNSGSNIELVSLTATENDTYTPSSGQAYNEVIVNVPLGIKFNGGVEHTYQLARDATVNEGDFCYYGSIQYGTEAGIYVYPVGYTGGTLGSNPAAVVAKETKTAGSTGTTYITVYRPE